IGYFKLASTKNLLGAPAQPIMQPIAPQPASAPAPSASSANFCPNCGSSVSSGARFCPGCGSSIN
ncbi:MAG: zinc-ribbon domain-containing protein, partial [Promethearchaeota archaeon]